MEVWEGNNRGKRILRDRRFGREGRIGMEGVKVWGKRMLRKGRFGREREFQRREVCEGRRWKERGG